MTVMPNVYKKKPLRVMGPVKKELEDFLQISVATEVKQEEVDI